MRADDQLVLGVDAGSETAAVCETVSAQFPSREIVIVACNPAAAVNPKISKLVQMTPHARYEHWILSDSEAVLDEEFLAAFCHEWAVSKADALTAGYRFANLDTLPQQLDAAAVLLTLWPGLAMVRRFGNVRLTLGACTGFRRADLDAIGGFAAVGDELAEDNRLGVLLGNAGRTIRLSAHVITLASDALSLRDYWRHQRRVAVTYRISSPAGFTASIITHGLPLSLLAVLAPYPFAPGIAAIFFFAAWILRWLAARYTARALNFPIPRLALVVLLASFVETACWVACWFSPRVWWSGRWWRISRGGKLTPSTQPKTIDSSAP
jgi:ceramide glucosyltransferase